MTEQQRRDTIDELLKHAKRVSDLPTPTSHAARVTRQEAFRELIDEVTRLRNQAVAA